jgi:hypothetical protein
MTLPTPFALSPIVGDPEAAETAHGSQETIRFGVFLNEIDEHLKYCLTGADQERDHLIFWLGREVNLFRTHSLPEVDDIAYSLAGAWTIPVTGEIRSPQLQIGQTTSSAV